MRLDIGCGMKARGDVNTDFRVFKAPNFVRADAHFLPFQNKVFESAYCSHVLEHLMNPVQAVKEMERVAKKVELYTPSFYSLDSTEDHLYSWNAITLKNLFETAFSHVYVEYTTRWKIIQGRLGKYMPILNMLLSKMGIRGELKVLAW